MGETHGFLREDFLHGEKGRVAEDEGLLQQCEFFYIEPRGTGEEIRGGFFFLVFERRRLGQNGNERKKLREGDKQGKGEQNREKTEAARKEERRGVFRV